jgi:hypothetical protein
VRACCGIKDGSERRGQDQEEKWRGGGMVWRERRAWFGRVVGTKSSVGSARLGNGDQGRRRRRRRRRQIKLGDGYLG